MCIIKPTCDFCNSYELESCYSPLGTTRGAHVLICHKCGLVQTSYDESRYKKIVSTTGEARWGNIRNGKILALKTHMPHIETECRSIINKGGRFLDIGSSRGAFVDYLCEISPSASITAIEPDMTVIGDYTKRPNVHFYGDLFEHCEYLGKYDFIYCSHSIVHSDSAKRMLLQIHNMLCDDGILFISCPYIDAINDNNIAEEFFIDKHKFHFSQIEC